MLSDSQLRNLHAYTTTTNTPFKEAFYLWRRANTHEKAASCIRSRHPPPDLLHPLLISKPAFPASLRRGFAVARGFRLQHAGALVVACGSGFLTPGLQHREHGISHWTARAIPLHDSVLFRICVLPELF